jgi:hypothetical protein
MKKLFSILVKKNFMLLTYFGAKQFSISFLTGIDPLASAVQNWKRLGNFSDDDDGDEEHQEDQGHQGGQWQQGDQRVRNELPVLQVGPGPSTSSGKISRPDLAPPPI